jgi:hypothetical protein
MNFSISKQELTKLYDKARKMYNECISNHDNAYLNEEITIPIEQIKLRNSEIKIVFSQDNNELYWYEIVLTLWDVSAIGRYTYMEDDQGNMIDDILVFF